MKIERNLIPQADKLDEVINVLYAIRDGARTDEEITQKLDDINVPRQGRYYRKATEILGFTERKAPNESILTELGERFCTSSLTEKEYLLKDAVLSCQIIQRVIPFIENKKSGFSHDDLYKFIFAVTNTTQKMAIRRTSSIISWLKRINMIYKNENMNIYVLNRESIYDIPIMKYEDIREPILPRTYELNEYDELSSKINIKSKQIVHMIDSVNLERSINQHNYLINLVAEKIRLEGIIPKSNKLIDLAINANKNSYIFEMKSFTKKNIRDQIRIGISQLYEYRYLLNATNAKLVLFIQEKLPNTLGWMQDYIENERNIFLLWDGNGIIHTTEKSKSEFSFLIN